MSYFKYDMEFIVLELEINGVYYPFTDQMNVENIVKEFSSLS